MTLARCDHVRSCDSCRRHLLFGLLVVAASALALFSIHDGRRRADAVECDARVEQAGWVRDCATLPRSP